jgi:hypothetical protein
MSLTVTQRPEITTDGSDPIVSKWNAVGNPILYKMQRKDFVFNQVNNNSSNIQLQFNSVNISTSFTAGDQLYIKSDNGVYDGFGLVTASTFSSPNTLVTVAIPYTSTAPGGYANTSVRELYRVEVEIYDIDDTLLGTFIYSPNTKGELIINVSPVLRAHILPDITLTTDIIQTDSAWVEFYIKYREVWVGSAESQTNDDSNTYYAVYGAMQIPSEYGGNMFEYVLDEDEVEKKLLTKFTKLKAWYGYPFISTFIINSTTDSVEALGSTPSSLTAGVYNVVKTQTADFDLVVENDTLTSELSETIPVELEGACRNPIMLIGRNSLGGVLQWLFDYSQEYTFDYGNGLKAKRLVLNANGLTINEWEALQDFITLGQVYKNNIVEFTSLTNKTSTRVGQQVYVLNSDGSKTGVIVIPTRNSTETKKIKHFFEIEIEYPQTFTV